MLNVTFDFSYFDGHSQYLEFYPTEFQTKYKVYQKNRQKKWQELDSPTSFAIKCNNDILDYAIPPFAGILREVYDLEDYSLKNQGAAITSWGVGTNLITAKDCPAFGGVYKLAAVQDEKTGEFIPKN